MLESWELLGEAFVEEVALGSSLLPRSTRSSFADRTRCPVPGNPDESWTDTPGYAHFYIKYKYVRTLEPIWQKPLPPRKL